MSTLAAELEPRACQARCTDDELIVTLLDGRALSVPLQWFPRLVAATAEQRQHVSLIGDGEGIHWPAIDEDVSLAGLLLGQPSVEYTRMPRRMRP